MRGGRIEGSLYNCRKSVDERIIVSKAWSGHVAVKAASKGPCWDVGEEYVVELSSRRSRSSSFRPGKARHYWLGGGKPQKTTGKMQGG